MPNHDDFEVTDLSDYEIYSQREITNILRHLAERNQLIQLQLKDGVGSTVTSILTVEENGGVIIDCAPDTHINQRIVDSKQIAFETLLDNIRIMFDVPGAEVCLYQDQSALRIPLPTVLVRLQRREFYRIPTPSATPLLCAIHIPDSDTARVVRLPLQNISGGGLALVDEQKLLNPTTGFIYPNCSIALPAGTKIVTALGIRNIREITLTNGKTIRRVGCQFVDLSSSMLNAVQRYITSLEREQNAKNTGML